MLEHDVGGPEEGCWKRFGWHQTCRFRAVMNANLTSRTLAKAISHLLAFVLTSALSAALVRAAPQGPLPVLTTAPLPAHVPTASATAGQGEWAPLLEQAVPNNPALLSSVISLMNDGRAAKNPGADRNPAL